MTSSFDPPSWRRALVALALLAVACGGSDSGEGGSPAGQRRGGGAGGPGGDFGGQRPAAAVPVEVVAVERGRIASFIETNGALEAENEVDVVARISAPIVELAAEEGMSVKKGQLLARLDVTESQAQLEVSRVALAEAEQNFERAKQLKQERLISDEAYEQASSSYDSIRAQYDSNRIQVGYARIVAPFAGQIVNRYVDFAQQVSVNTPLFRLSDFTPLLCPIQVPERDLANLRLNQPAYLEVEAWADERFPAKVLRISPVVDPTTGTIKVTLEVDGQGRLRPGMFAGIFIEIDSKEDALVIPRAALALDSVDDAVYVAKDGVATRNRVTLGFQQGDSVEILEGLSLGETVVTVGQDGLSDGTPIQILRGPGAVDPGAVHAAGGGGESGDRSTADSSNAVGQSDSPPTDPAGAGAGRGAGGPGGPGGGRRPNFAEMTPEQLEAMKARMRARGMTDEQIEERIRRAKEQSSSSER